MTIREAVARIKDHIKVHHIKEDRAIKIVQALNMAIEALEATKWHYPSRGEYPTDGETVLVAFQEGGLWYFANAEYHEGGWASAVDLGNIIAWQAIKPPRKEE